jgi:hypothetical protein
VQDRQRAYVQVVLPPDLNARSPDWNWTDGWPLHGPNIPSVSFADVDVASDELAKRLGIDFQRGLDLGDGLGARSIALLELQGGLC